MKLKPAISTRQVPVKFWLSSLLLLTTNDQRLQFMEDTMNTQDIHRMRRHLIKDDIERPEPPAPEENPFLSEKKLRFVAAWTGNLIAAARTAGYKDPKNAAYKLMKDPEVVQALQTKQEA